MTATPARPGPAEAAGIGAGMPDALRRWIGPATVEQPRAVGEGGVLYPMALLGRVSTGTLQDPTLSLPRQLEACTSKLPEGAAIVAHFWDIETGRMEIAGRGHGNLHEMFPEVSVPRDGGLADLLAEAARPDRRFDFVICEDIGRAGRRSRLSSQLEHQLEQLGVRLLASDEPIVLHDTGRRKGPTATAVLTRRMKQGVTEWYVVEMLEKSWGGFETHTAQGFNVGKPCYGYRALEVAHPVPAKRAKGIKKTLLQPDPTEAVTVERIFTWRVVDRLGYAHIAERLNTDLVANPPPTPVDPARALGVWTYSSVREVLTNPKHTGYMVWNRHARKGAGRNRANPVTDWVWSPQPTHDAIVTVETFLAAQQVAKHRGTSRSRPGPLTIAAASPPRVYALRSYLYCGLCGRRMFGKVKGGHAYYVCEPKKAWRAPDHPVAAGWVREDFLLDGISRFMAEYVFGDYRRVLLDAELSRITEDEHTARQHRVAALQAAIKTTLARSRKLTMTLELADEDDLDRALVREINQRQRELRGERERLQAELADVEELIDQQSNPALLDRLPLTTTKLDLGIMPDEMRRGLFDAFALRVTYHHNTRHAAADITLTGATIATVAAVARRVAGQHPATTHPAPDTTEHGQLAIHRPLALPRHT